MGLLELGRPGVGRDPLPVVLDTVPGQLFLGGKLSVEVKVFTMCSLVPRWLQTPWQRLWPRSYSWTFCSRSSYTCESMSRPLSVAVVWIQVPTAPAPSCPYSQGPP